MTTQADLHASERAMQMICAVTTCYGSDAEKMTDVNRVVEAWVFHPDALRPDAMIEDLPPVAP